MPESTARGRASSVAQTIRKPAAERLAETRERLLDAVIDSLAESGYAATSTTEVARRSGLTRGAQLHHFGTKDAMLTAAAEHLPVREGVDEITAALARIPDDATRVEQALALIAELRHGREPAAYAELWLASRNHPELVDALHDADVTGRDQIRGLFGDDIVERGGADFDALLDLILYALRGMTLDAHLATAEEQAERHDLITGMARYLELALSTHSKNEKGTER
jgi:AcrR family transcriptional regulator